MLTPSEVATIRAALRYWKEDIYPHGEAVANPYFDEGEAGLLEASEVDRLRNRLKPGKLRYIALAPDATTIISSELSENIETAEATGSLVATVIPPATEI